MTGENTAFSKRLLAFIIDMIILGIASSILTFPFSNTENYKKLTKESTQVMEDYLDKKITPETYLSRSSDISYDLSKEIGLKTIITIGIYILYFIVYQFYNNGKTLGKKLMKIKIVSDNDKGELSMNQIAVRSLIINSILVNLITLSVTIFGTKDVYFITSMVMQVLDMILMFTIAIMVLSREDKRGLHDIITHTKVINEE